MNIFDNLKKLRTNNDYLNLTLKTYHFSFPACDDYGKIQCPKTEACYDPNYDICNI